MEAYLLDGKQKPLGVLWKQQHPNGEEPACGATRGILKLRTGP